jgi:hypothetical protein
MIAKESSEIAVAIPDGRLDSEGFLKGLYRVANTSGRTRNARAISSIRKERPNRCSREGLIYLSLLMCEEKRGTEVEALPMLQRTLAEVTFEHYRKPPVASRFSTRGPASCPGRNWWP